MFLVTGFCLFWAIPWLFFSYTNLQPVTVEGASGVKYAPYWTTYFTGLMGFPVLALGARFGLSIYYERVVVTADGQVVYYDWLGREALRTTLKGVVRAEDPKPNADKDEVYTFTVQTLDGSFRFSTMLRGYRELLALLNAGK